MSARKNRTVLPFRDVDPHEILNIFSLNGTGEAGLFVSVDSDNPNSTDNYYSSVAVGADFSADGIYSNKWVNPNQVSVAGTGDNRATVVGMTIQDVKISDANGNNYDWYQQKKAEDYVVTSGETVQIARRGLFTLSNGVVLNPSDVQPGFVGVVSGAGKLAAVDSANLIYNSGVADPTKGLWTEQQVVGRFISNTGRHNDAVIFELKL